MRKFWWSYLQCVDTGFLISYRGIPWWGSSDDSTYNVLILDSWYLGEESLGEEVLMIVLTMCWYWIPDILERKLLVRKLWWSYLQCVDTGFLISYRGIPWWGSSDDSTYNVLILDSWYLGEETLGEEFLMIVLTMCWYWIPDILERNPLVRNFWW